MPFTLYHIITGYQDKLLIVVFDVIDFLGLPFLNLVLVCLLLCYKVNIFIAFSITKRNPHVSLSSYLILCF